METVQAAAPDTWFQAYLPGDAKRRDALIERIDAAGFAAGFDGGYSSLGQPREQRPHRLLPAVAAIGPPGVRWRVETALAGRDIRQNAAFTRDAAFRKFLRDSWRTDPVRLGNSRYHGARSPELGGYRANPARWRGNLVIKGILHTSDAERAVALGADGIIVSNHGGRQLDGAVEPLAVLPGICESVAHKTAVMMDSGIRRRRRCSESTGLGSTLCLPGSALCLRCNRWRGVRHAITLLRDEVDRNMAMLGAQTIADVNKSVIV
jgi:L-lactate dehydrogenase (cytochrome)